MDATTEQLIQHNFANLAERLAKAERRIQQLETQDGGYIAGTWTPVFAGTTTPGSFTYSVQGGEYTVMGNRCFFNGRVAISAIGVAPVGVITITGLPFAGVAGAQAIAGGATMILWVMNISAAGYTQVEGQLGNGSSAMTLVKSGDGVGGASVVAADFVLVGANLEFRFFGSYRIA
jgi:hypothetical protein